MKAENEIPPVFGSWKKWYGLVLGFLLIQIVLYFLITRYFA